MKNNDENINLNSPDNGEGGEVVEPAESSLAEVDCNLGLSSDEVNARIADGKINGDQDVKTKSVAQILRENIFTFFNFVFVFLAVLQCFFLDWGDGFIRSIGKFGFLGLVLFNTAIGIFQEMRSKRTIDKLSLISAPKAKVVRDGKEVELAVKDIVLDDIMVLSAGNQICADAVVREGAIEVNESLLTGEADLILKHPGDKILSGSFVVSGKAKAQAEHIGLDNFAAKISAGAKYFKKPNSEIFRSLMFIVKIMSAIIVPVGLALFLVKYYLQPGSVLNGGNTAVNDYVITTIGTIVGMIPSGLVALASTVFCVSVIRLSKRKTLAQDLYCVETLARVDTLCLDKTGTITEGSMEVHGIEPALPSSKAPEEYEQEIKQIIKNLTSALSDDNATAMALRNYTSELSPTAEAQKTIPFSSDRKYSGARFDGVSYVVGAPEFALENPSDEIMQKTREMAKNGFRVMILASSTCDFDGNRLPENLSQLAFIYITDKIRKEAPETLRFFKQEGVNVKVISGDNPETVRAVAMRAGLENCDKAIDMSTLKTEEEVAAAATEYTVFGRVLPDQKLILVNALKAAGHTVAMTGDGVNDVLALKAADCSIAMASGSDAAKNVSSLVLLDSNFASMPKVVAEGRRSINNLERSAALYIMKTLYNTLLAILFMFVPDALPFSTSNLTLMGGVTIGMPSVVLALEPNTDRVEGRFLPKVFKNAFPGGITVLFAAAAILICNHYFLTNLTDGQATTLFVIIITFVGFMLLAKVSLPFTWLHFATYVLMIVIFVAVYVVPLPKDFLINLFSLDKNLTWEMGKAILTICAILLPIYIGLVMLFKVGYQKQRDKFESAFTRLDAFLRNRDVKAMEKARKIK